MSTVVNTQVKALAERIFVERAASNFSRTPNESDALASVRSAEVFVSAIAKIESGEVKATPTGPQLADCWAPNLKITSPFNIVSQQHGDLKRVAEINKWLVANPEPDTEAQVVTWLAKFNRIFPALNTWDLSEIRTAAATFPSYCSAA